MCINFLQQRHPAILPCLQFSTGIMPQDRKLDTYKEWTFRRPWKERKRANKAQKMATAANPTDSISRTYIVWTAFSSGLAALLTAAGFHIMAMKRSLLMQNAHMMDQSSTFKNYIALDFEAINNLTQPKVQSGKCT